MKIYLNEDLTIVKRDYEDTYKGTEDYYRISVYVPENVYNKYNSIYPLYSGKVPSGDVFGPFIINFGQRDDTNESKIPELETTSWYYWEDAIDNSFMEEAGRVTFTIQMRLQLGSDPVMTKTIGNVKFEVVDAVTNSGNDIIILNPDKVADLVASMQQNIKMANDAVEGKMNKNGDNSAVNVEFKNVSVMQNLDADVLIANTRVQTPEVLFEYVVNDEEGNPSRTVYASLVTDENGYLHVRFTDAETGEQYDDQLVTIEELIERFNTLDNKKYDKGVVDTQLGLKADKSELNAYAKTSYVDAQNGAQNSNFESRLGVLNSNFTAMRNFVMSKLNGENPELDEIKEISKWIEENMAQDGKTLIQLITELGTKHTDDIDELSSKVVGVNEYLEAMGFNLALIRLSNFYKWLNESDNIYQVTYEDREDGTKNMVMNKVRLEYDESVDNAMNSLLEHQHYLSEEKWEEIEREVYGDGE